MIRWLRGCGFILVLSSGGLVSHLAKYFISDSLRLRRFRALVLHKISPALLWTLNLRGVTQGISESPRGSLLVANHLSYLDIPAIAALCPVIFVTSMEVREDGILGTVADLGGSQFIERRSRQGLPEEISELESCLRAGINVVLFPEATSTNGEKILPFRNAFFEAAIRAGAEIHPLFIQYTYRSGEKLIDSDKALLHYFGEIQFFEHLWQVFRGLPRNASIQVFEKVPSEFRDRKRAALWSFNRLSEFSEAAESC